MKTKTEMGKKFLPLLLSAAMALTLLLWRQRQSHPHLICSAAEANAAAQTGRLLPICG
jgi:hypothetical protein